MEENHLDDVMKIELNTFSSPWTKDAYKYELDENQYATYYIFEENNEILAYCGVWCLFDQAQITTIGVKKEARRKKIGSTLMDTMINKAVEMGCETLSLEVRVSNQAAINLYKSYGFECVNIRKSYYQDNNEDAFLMIKAIGGLNYE